MAPSCGGIASHVYRYGSVHNYIISLQFYSFLKAQFRRWTCVVLALTAHWSMNHA